MADDRDEDAAVLCILLVDLSRARRLAGRPGSGRDELARMLELGANTLAAPQPELSRRILQMVALVERPAAEWSELQTRCDELLDLVARKAGEPEVLRIAGRLLAALGLRLEEEHVPGSEHFLDRLEVVARQCLGEDVDFLQVLGRFAESLLRLGRFDAAHRLATELLEALARVGLGDHWLHLRWR